MAMSLSINLWLFLKLWRGSLTGMGAGVGGGGDSGMGAGVGSRLGSGLGFCGVREKKLL